MKIKLLIFGLPLLMTGCASSPNPFSREEKPRKEYVEAVRDGEVEEIYSDQWLEKRIKKGWYEGHEYLIYEKPKYKGGYGGLVHNPNCPCYLIDK